MKLLIKLSLIGMVLFLLSYPTQLCFGDSRVPATVNSFSQASEVAMKKGTKVEEKNFIQAPDGSWEEVTFQCYIFKKGGMGDGGWWTFYTIKYYPDTNATVVIVYKPEMGTLIIFRHDIDTYGNHFFNLFIEQEHSWVVWDFLYTDEKVADGILKEFLRPMDWVQEKSPWGFVPGPEMREFDCWPIEPGGNK
jgi:hypothetical protein